MNVLNGTYQTAGKGPKVQVNAGWNGWTMQGIEVQGIENIPPGKYEVKFWQERLSNVDEKKYILQSSTLEINITDNENTTQNFTFTKPQKTEQ